MRPFRPRSVLIIVQNLPLPGDRRVWLECQALRDAGWEVSAITPMAPGDPAYSLHEGVHLYKYPAPTTGVSVLSYIWEFLYCWIRTALLTVRVWRRHRFSVLQACNPPDTFWLLALVMRPLGVRFVFDQHDLCPEVYLSRGRGLSPVLLRGTYWLERMTYRAAARVISTNESYRAVAIERGHVRPETVTVVRTGPDMRRMHRSDPDPGLRRGRSHLAVYLGVMGLQDGVDVLIEAIDQYVHVLGRDDCTFAVLGAGDCWQQIRDQVAELGLDEHVYLPGRVSDEELFAHLSTADVGLCPDPPNPLNDVSTMNKTMEYMAFEVPVVSFDLKETRFSAQDSAVYVADSHPEDFAKAIAALLDDPAERRSMGRRGRERVEEHLDWKHQRPHYLAVYASLD